jgi:adenylate kinase
MKMRLIIFGPPGSGKGSCSSRLKKIGIEKISTGDLFRASIKRDDELGKKVKKYVTSGQLVPDEIVISVVKERIKELDDFILDGFPRTIKQAKALDSMTKIDAIILIKAHDEILIEKALARRICSNPECDGNYNVAKINKVIDGVEYNLPPLLPKDDMKCDKCGSRLIKRKDDELDIIKERLKIYYEQTKPIIDYYKKKKIPFIEIWMNRPPDTMTEKIIEEIKKLKFF